jgi:hypothetical protein
MADLGQLQRWILSAPASRGVIRLQIHVERNSLPARSILFSEHCLQIT